MLNNAPKVLIVEDQNIVALDIQNCLKKLNYDVTGIAYSGAGAIKKAEETFPDIILMDITLKGDMDGIAAAKEIRKRFNIPVIYLTAYADQITIQKAKLTEPMGYLIKPFNEKELNRTIEIALHLSKVEKEIKKNEDVLSFSFNLIECPMVILNNLFELRYINKNALDFLECDEDTAFEKDLKAVFGENNFNLAQENKFITKKFRVMINEDKHKNINIKINTYKDFFIILFEELPNQNANKIEKTLTNLLTGILGNISLLKEINSNAEIAQLIDNAEKYSINMKDFITEIFNTNDF